MKIQTPRIRPSRAYMLTAASLAAMAACVGTASAQTTADVGEVVVTASRIQSAGFTAPTPTTVLGAAELTRKAPASILESLNDIPSFAPNTTPQNTAASIGGTNTNAGAAQVNLRSLGTNRTLLLINGRRTGGSVDVNQFPTILTQRVDVVTGGASAAYGSDAVAGVVNIILDTKFNGLKGEAQYGQSKYGDDETWRASAALGTNFLGERGHLLIGVEYADGKGARSDDTRRPWVAARRGATIPNAGYLTNGLPANLNVDNYNYSTMNAGGLIVSGPLKGITFDNGGVPRQFQYGQVFGNNMIGGEIADPNTFYLKTPVERYALFVGLNYEFNSKLRGWAEYNNAQVIGKSDVVSPRDQGNLTIQAANPFIPASIKAQMTALNLTTLTMGRINTDLGQPFTTNTNDVYRYAAGLEGDIVGSWKWDAYVQYGLATSFAKTVGSRNEARWRQAIDVVANAQGIPVCRNNTGGCVPFNLFGPQASSQAARDFVLGVQTTDSRRQQTSAAINLHGEPLSTWAGPVALAVGGEYRKEETDTTSDPIALARGWNSGNTQPLHGAYTVKEAYAEIAVPLAKGLTLARSLDLNAAARYTDYSTTGSVTTWKIGGVWEPTSEILLRATRSRDIRAPGIGELFSPGNTLLNNAINFKGPFAGVAFQVPITGGGNPNLRAEKADTFTGGVTYRPKWARLRLSADYYSIKIKDQIGAPGVTVIVERCRLGNQEFCNLITFDAVGTIVSVFSPSVNNNNFTNRGIDLEASYSLPLQEVRESLPGTLSGRFFATRTFEFSTTDYIGTTDRVGQNSATTLGGGNIPTWILNYSLTYEVGRFSGTAQWRYVSKGTLDALAVPGTATSRLNNDIPAQTLTNLSASYDLIRGEGRRLQLFGAINNLFNKGPPFPINPVGNFANYYDNGGTSYRMGVRFTY